MEEVSCQEQSPQISHCHYLVFGDIVTNLLPRHWGKNVGRHLGLNGGLHTAITVTVTNDPEHADHGLINFPSVSGLT